MAVTFTSSLMASAVVPKRLHAGVNSVYAHVTNVSTAYTAGQLSVFKMVKVPVNCKIVGFHAHLTGSNDGTYSVVVDGNTLATACVGAAISGINVKSPVVDTTESATQNYVDAEIRVTPGTTTSSVIASLVLHYTAD